MKDSTCQSGCSILMKNYFVLTLFIVSPCLTKAQSHSAIIYDRQQSQYFGAYNLGTLHHIVYNFQDQHMPDSLFNENTFVKKTAGVGCRMAKLLLLDGQIDKFIGLAQHEVFGHGARQRELGYKGNSYNMTMFFPFGSGHGYAQYGTLQASYTQPTRQEIISVNIGGVDGDMLFANHITSQILLNDTLHYRQGILYIFTQNDLLYYLWRSRNMKFTNTGNDMTSYVENVNQMYATPGKEIYDTKKLYMQSLISLANPIQFYSAFAILYNYAIKGQKHLKRIPMIKFGTVRYLPTFNYSLTPFGSQYHFMNYFRYKGMLISGDFNWGDNTFNTFYGLSLKAFNVIDSKRFTFNFHLDVWDQPELELTNNDDISSTNKMGGALKADIMFRPINAQHKLGLFMQTGYKTKGYVTGDALAEAFILRYGMSLRI